MENLIIEFNKYVDQFDLTNIKIRYKKEHTLRVLSYANKICNGQNIDGIEKKLALISSLLHDIGRFEQYTKYGTYDDSKSIDHGDLSYDILNNDDYILKYVEPEYKNIVLNSVKYHNKLEIPEEFDELTKKVCNVVRDADKIDIIITQCNYSEEYKGYNDVTIEDKIILDDEIIKYFLEERLLDKNVGDDKRLLLLRLLAFLFDINYRTSFKIINKCGIIDKKLDILKNILQDNKQYKLLKVKIGDYLESHIKL